MNHSPNLDLFPPTSFMEPSRNINLHEGGIRKRGGTSHVNETALTDTPQIMGLHDYQLTGGSQFLMVATADGKIYKNFTDTVKTGLTTGKVVRFITFGGLVFSCNGSEIPQYWDGAAASTSDIAAPAASWSAGNYPTWMVVHSNGLARRVWVGGVANAPYTVDVSKIGDGGDYTSAVISFYIETGTGDGVVGGFELGERLFLMSKKNAFYMNDSDADSNNWGYKKAIWTGGLAHHGLIAVAPNDVHLMAEDGEIYSFTAVQSYGDYKAASLTRPSYMHKWIQDNIDLSKIAQFHSVYDPVLRATKWFMVKNGSNQVDICLPLFIDRPIDKAWGAPHENTSYASGYKASCSALVKKTTGTYKVYIGDYLGFVWELENGNRNDNGNPIEARVKWSRLNLEDPRTSKHFNQAMIVSQPAGSFSANMSATIDDKKIISRTLSFSSIGDLFDTGLFDTAVFGEGALTDSKFKIGAVGRRIQPQITENTLNQDLFLSNLIFDFKPMGKKQGV